MDDTVYWTPQFIFSWGESFMLEWKERASAVCTRWDGPTKKTGHPEQEHHDRRTRYSSRRARLSGLRHGKKLFECGNKLLTWLHYRLLHETHMACWGRSGGHRSFNITGLLFPSVSWDRRTQQKRTREFASQAALQLLSVLIASFSSSGCMYLPAQELLLSTRERLRITLRKAIFFGAVHICSSEIDFDMKWRVFMTSFICVCKEAISVFEVNWAQYFGKFVTFLPNGTWNILFPFPLHGSAIKFALQWGNCLRG